MKKELIILIVVIVIIIVIIIIGAGFFFMKGNGTGEGSGGVAETPETEIRIRGSGTEMVIAPSKNREISGIVTLTMEKVPEGTKSVIFLIYAGMPRMDASPSIIGIDKNGSDGWFLDFDTYAYTDVDYTIEGHTFNVAQPGEGIEQTSAVRVQAQINNSG